VLRDEAIAKAASKGLGQMLMQTGYSRRPSPFGGAFFTRLFKWIATALRLSGDKPETVIKTGGNETRGKTFLFPGSAARHFLRSARFAPGIEVPPGALENGLQRVIRASRVVEIKTGGVT